MNCRLLFPTVAHLRPIQVVHQVKNHLVKPKYVPHVAPAHEIPQIQTAPIPRWHCMDGNCFSFLNLRHEFSGWNFTENGMLWAYNQNYFDFLNQEGVTAEEGCRWIDRFITDLPQNHIGLDPYPIALRGINWIKFFVVHPECITRERENSLYSQYCLLEKKIEYHLLGNHILEDAFSLYIGAVYFQDMRLLKRAEKLLLLQLEEQTLNDGAHYEQSPMYHSILLDRLLDCINFRPLPKLKHFAELQLGWLQAIVYNDGDIPMMNDSAHGIAPTSDEIFGYAHRLRLTWTKSTLGDSGYRRLSSENMEVTVDVGNIKAAYQPGHTHADTLNYDLRINEIPVVIDTGISTYNKTERRQYERSTIAHNCVSPSEKNSCEVWGGFRVGRRCVTTLIEETSTRICAEHNGFVTSCRRDWTLENGTLTIEDHYDGEAVSYLHLAPEIDFGKINVIGATSIEIIDDKASKEYNKFYDAKVIKIHFKDYVKYQINESIIGC